VAELDAEHDACAAALAELARTRSVDALRALIKLYEAHFAHEEALCDAYVYQRTVDPGDASSFNADENARKSHYADHARLLDALREQAACGDAQVPAAFIDATLRGFEGHANRYDDAYAPRLAAALAAGAG